MRRFALVTLTSLSAIVAILWAASYVWSIHFSFPGFSANSIVTVESIYGRIPIQLSNYSPPPANRGPAIAFRPIDETRDSISTARSVGIMMDQLHNMPSFEWSTFAFPEHRGVIWSGRTIAFPHWLPFLLLAFWPLLAALLGVVRRKRRSEAPNHRLQLTGDARE